MFEKLIAAVTMAISHVSELSGSEPFLTENPVTDAATSMIESNFSYPGDRCCRLYKGYNYNGASYNFCLHDGTTYTNYGLSSYGFNNNVSSYYCGKNVEYDFCNTTDGGCASHTDSNSGAGT